MRGFCISVSHVRDTTHPLVELVVPRAADGLDCQSLCTARVDGIHLGLKASPGVLGERPWGGHLGSFQCGVAYSTQGPFQLTYFITSTQPRKYSQELADNAYTPKATCYPIAHFTTLKHLTIISFWQQAQLSK